jgi:hypothetical protein
VLAVAAFVLALGALTLAGPAEAGHRGVPVIDSVSPARVPVGGKLVIRGRHFSHQTRRSTVVFRGFGGRVAFARPARAFPRKLVVRVPSTLERLMRTTEGDPSTLLPTRFRLRVISNRRRSRLTGPRRSPVVVPAPVERSAAPGR